MNFLKKLFFGACAVWGIIIFTLLMILFIPAFLFTDIYKEPKKSENFLKVSKLWNWLFIYLSGSSLKVSGKQHFAKDQNYIVIYNHNSFLDVPISCPFTPGANKTIGKIEMMKIPLFSIPYKRGSVLIDRKSKTSRFNSYSAMLSVLNAGMHMGVYPEGTRNKTTEPLLPFKPGAFKLAIETGKSIIPAVITGTRKALPSGKGMYYVPGKFTLTFFAPISPAGNTEEALSKACFDIMYNAYVANQP